MFGGAIAVSPSLWWADGHMLTLPVEAGADRRVYVCVGEHEEGRDAPVWPVPQRNPERLQRARMVSNLETWSGHAEAAGVKITSAIFAPGHDVGAEPVHVERHTSAHRRSIIEPIGGCHRVALPIGASRRNASIRLGSHARRRPVPSPEGPTVVAMLVEPYRLGQGSTVWSWRGCAACLLVVSTR